MKTLFIEPGGPWENGYCESCIGKLQDELLTREIFFSLAEARVLVEQWRREYNTIRPHSARGYRPSRRRFAPRPGSSTGELGQPQTLDD